MCWVMPPASPAATSVSRMASSSDVLPWSTWPMIVTTGGRGREILVGVVELGLRVDVVGRVHDLDLLVELVGEHLHGVVGQRLRQRGHLAELISFLITSGTGTPRYSATSLTVEPELTWMTSAWRTETSCGTGSV